MKKWVCSVCGYVYEGANPPAECPVCHVSGDKFIEQKEEKSWAAEHVVGVGKAFGSDVPEEVQKEIIDGLRANFEGECSEVGMYLAMARVAHREGYPEIGLYWEKAAHEEAEHIGIEQSVLFELQVRMLVTLDKADNILDKLSILLEAFFRIAHTGSYAITSFVRSSTPFSPSLS